MKRSGFLRSLAGIIAAPSVLSGIGTNNTLPVEPKTVVPPVNTIDEKIRVGDMVRFKNGQQARCQSIVMGKPTFRNIRNEPLLDTEVYNILKYCG